MAVLEDEMRTAIAKEWVADIEKQMIGDSSLGKKVTSTVCSLRSMVKKHQQGSAKHHAKSISIKLAPDTALAKIGSHYKLFLTKYTDSPFNVPSVPDSEDVHDLCELKPLLIHRPKLSETIVASKAFYPRLSG